MFVTSELKAFRVSVSSKILARYITGPVLRIFAVSIMLSALAAGCALPHRTPPGQATQWAVYRPAPVEPSGRLPSLAEMLAYGDTGLGYLAPVDGELVFEGGHVFQVRADGKVYQPPPTERLSTAIISRFQLDRAVRLPSGSGRDELKRELNRQATDLDAIAVFRVVGRFDRIAVSAPEPIRNATLPPRVREHQLARVSGVITGFRLPEVAPGLHAPGLHMVFVSHDRLSGGRVSEFELLDGTLEIHLTDRFLYIHPKR